MLTMPDLLGLFPKRPLGVVSINWKPIRRSYGGMNFFVQQLQDGLVRRGYKVRNTLKSDVNVIFIAHPWMTHQYPYHFDDVVRFKRDFPNVKVILRINECDARKSTSHMDGWLEQWQSVSDHTVFISEWLRDYHAARWFDKSEEHCCIVNGADSRFFHPIGSASLNKDKCFRVVTHHWANAYNKGFHDYVEIDNSIFRGELKGVKLVVIGRWPDDIKWKTAELHGPRVEHKLAKILRSCHAYVTGSVWEPGGMHFIEGVQCGLPVVYHQDGGGIPEVASRYGLEYSIDVCGAIEQMRREYDSHRRKVLSNPPSGEEMTLRFINAIQKVVACG